VPKPRVSPNVSTFSGQAKSLIFCPVFCKHFPRLPDKGKEAVKKYTC
jgi:hypothetical protein